MYMRILTQEAAAAQADSKGRKKDKPKYEYDSDEDIEGGTWEHKKRKHEMQKTHGKATGFTTSYCSCSGPYFLFVERKDKTTATTIAVIAIEPAVQRCEVHESEAFGS